MFIINSFRYLLHKNKTGVCYVPELDDTEYTYMNFYNIVNGNEELARVLFDMVDWQSPETKLDELVQNDEINFCVNCENAYDSYEVDKCPHCGQLKVIDYLKVMNLTHITSR